jgi:hypothetical protein
LRSSGSSRPATASWLHGSLVKEIKALQSRQSLRFRSVFSKLNRRALNQILVPRCEC